MPARWTSYPTPGLVRNQLTSSYNASQADIEAAAHAARAHDYILNLPQGYDTLIGDRGIRLSGGQQQRLCIARAIAVGPEVLLMDEPCSALDPRSTASVEALIRELRQTFTIVVVTHNMQQAARVSDLTAFFFEGKLIEAGATDGMFTNPKNKQPEDYVTGRFG